MLRLAQLHCDRYLSSRVFDDIIISVISTAIDSGRVGNIHYRIFECTHRRAPSSILHNNDATKCLYLDTTKRSI
jgi:hypothetical protein